MAKTLHYNFLTNPSLTDHTTGTATPDLSITRATKATMVDADGYIREVQAGEARFTGATFNHNLAFPSENGVDGAEWGLTAQGLGSVPVLVTEDYTQVSDGNGGTVSLDRVTFEAGGTGAGDRSYVQITDTTQKDGETYTTSVWVATVTGTAELYFLGSNTWANGSTTITTTPTRIEVTALCQSTGTGNLRLGTIGTGEGAAAVDIIFGGIQIENVSGKSDQSASAYIKNTSTTASLTSLSGSSTLGLLVEEARTNICLQSEDITQFTAGNSSPVADQATSPDGSTTADQLVDNSATGTGVVQVSQSITVATSTVYTFSAFLKADQLSWAHLAVTALDVLAIDQYYDLNNGVVGSSPGANVDDSGIEDYGNGWYRCWLTFTSHGTDTSGVLRIQCADADSDNTVDLDGTSSIFVWGAQLEAGAFPTSYIATTTTSVTRNADVVTTSDVTWYNSSAGTLYSSGSAADVSATTRRTVTLGNSTDGYAHRILASGIGNHVGFHTDTSTFNISPSASITDGNTFRAVTGVAENDVAGYTDGNAGTPDTGYTVPTISSIHIGSLIGTTHIMNGHIAEVAYFNERLANATLLDYSTNGLPTAFPGTVAGDGGHIWPPRANDPRWTQIITDSGITASGNFIDDVHEALEALASTTGAMDDLWKKFKAAYSVTDTSEPFTY